jgi:hypothetical protein
MAKYIPVIETDASLPLLQALSAKVKQYVVTWFSTPTVRSIYNVVGNLSKAFQECKKAKLRNPLAHAACYLVVGASYYFVDNGGEFHP